MPFLTLQDVSRQNNQIQETCQLLSTKFLSIYGREPVAFAYAPGRVNLIGEHIDYEGYSVLPMALDRYFVLIAISLPLPPVNMENRSSSPDNGRYADEDNAGVVRVTHLDSEKFTSSSFSTNPTIPVQRENQHWTNYVHCGYKGAWLLHDPPKDSADTDSIENDQETDAETARSTETMSGQPLNLLVTGNVPLASGLSSSSALVVASVLASLYGRRILMEGSSSSSLSNKTTTNNLSGEQIADICRRAEQYIGTMGGGMDQTISCLGYAQLIQFHQSKPPTSTKVVLSPKSTFVVAESTTPSPKVETVNQRYNKRVVECMLASKVLGKKLGISHYLHLTTLQQVQHQVQNNGSKSNANDKNGMPSLCEMEQLVLSNLKSTPYTLDEILKELNVSNHHHENEKGKEWLCAFPHFRLEDEAEDDSKRWLSMIGNVIDEASIQGYSLQARAQHVYSEAQRVLDFHQLCCTFQQQQQQQQLQDSGSNLSATITENEVLKQLGDIMNESHTSCRDLYECSSKELDELTNKCRNYRSDCHGVSACYGSRLTGAGWGGSTVSLVVSDDYAASFIERLLERQKRDRVNNNIPPDSNMYCKRVFTCKPGQGAFLMEY